jgi:class 3 adenylate cyclase
MVARRGQPAVLNQLEADPERSFREESVIRWIQLSMLRFVRGGEADILPDQIFSLVEQIPIGSSVKIYMSVFWAMIGNMRKARAELERYWPERIEDLRRDMMWLPAVSAFAYTVTLLDDRVRAQVLYDKLLPYERRCLVLPLVMCWGSIARLLGALAALLGRYDAAERHFELALKVNSRLGSKPWLALAQADYAKMLITRNVDGDKEKAVELLNQSIDLSTEIGLKGVLLERTLDLKLQAQGASGKLSRSSIDSVVESVERKRPSLTEKAAPDGTVTLMFSDMVDFTVMTERLGDREAFKVMERHNAILRRAMRRHDGYEVEAQGDGFLVAFPKAGSALRCAVEIHRAMAQYSTEHPEQPMRVRIGIHTGEPVKEGARFFGKTVILAARIAAQAQGNEILVSSVVKALTESAGEFSFDNGREMELKGLAGKHHVYLVRWQPEVSADESSSTSVEGHAANGASIPESSEDQ